MRISGLLLSLINYYFLLLFILLFLNYNYFYPLGILKKTTCTLNQIILYLKNIMPLECSLLYDLLVLNFRFCLGLFYSLGLDVLLFCVYSMFA